MRRVITQHAKMWGILIGALMSISTLLFIFSTKQPLQAAHLEPNNGNVAYPAAQTVFPETGALLGLVTDLNSLDTLERQVGKKHSVIKIYQAFWHGGFWEDIADSISSRGATEFLSFDPVIDSDPSPTTTTESDLNSCQVLSGDYDSTIITFATEIKSWGQPLLVSSAGEMNGDWPGWAGAKNFGPDCTQTYTETTNLYGYYGCKDPVVECADGPERYRDMYRHIHDTFSTVGMTNVTWVWVVNHDSFPDEINNPWNVITNYYPGDEYVDVISVDGFNWGDPWKTFSQIFGKTLTTLRNAYPGKPIIIGEFASVEATDPMSKANWISDVYSRIKSDWPEIRTAVWYNSSVGGDPTFPLTSSPESIRAYKEAVSDPYFIGDLVGYAYLPFISKPLCPISGSGGTESIELPGRIIRGMRIDLKKRALQMYGFSLWEIEIYGPGTGNLAKGATATASSSQNSPGCYGCSPDQAVDGYMNTRWGSKFYEPQWFEITFPAPQAVNRIVLEWENAYATEYCITVIE